MLQAGKRSQEAGVMIARQFSEVMLALLLVVPMNSILAVSDTVMANVDEEEGDMQPEASTSGMSGQFDLHSHSDNYPHIILKHVWYLYRQQCIYLCMCA